MSIAALLAGTIGLCVSLRYPLSVDAYLRAVSARVASYLEAPPHPDSELELVGALSASLRSGLSLDAALEAFASSPAASPGARSCARLALQHRPGPGFLSTFLRSSLLTGAPALGSLASFERALRCRRRLQQKARSSTSQCRAQAEVLSWLPWALALAILATDPAWFTAAARSPFAWALWACATGACGLGRAWIHRSLSRALSPRAGAECWEEEQVPELVLGALAELAQGRDVETALETVLPGLDPAFARAFREGGLLTGRIKRLHSLFAAAASQGGPVREDLLSFLEALQEDTEARWEERVQRLPVTLLAPLFACFFPAALLVLAGLLLPLLGAAL